MNNDKQTPPFACGLLLVWLLVATPVLGETIHLKQAGGLNATAELLPGDADKPALLILHGFLQTRDFFTVRRLGDALNEMGFTVLLPNLTLGVDDRRQSLACEAIHTHSLPQDSAEIEAWVEWLYQTSGKPVSLIGHSAGSLELLAYLSSYPSAKVDRAILISLVAFAQGPIAKENETDRQRALAELGSGKEVLSAFRLAFCDEYTTTAENYLSYVTWNGKKTIEILNNLSISPIIILGSEDRRLGDDWLPSLKQTGLKVVLIPGANHFFDHEHEFDLMDTVSERLGPVISPPEH